MNGIQEVVISRFNERLLRIDEASSQIGADFIFIVVSVQAFHLLLSLLVQIYASLYLTAYAKMRYYEQRYPEVDELVMVQVRQIAEMGAYVKLVRFPRCLVLGNN